LQGGAVGDQTGDVLADPSLDLANPRRLKLQNRLVLLDDER
jgi:hypothetical protein